MSTRLSSVALALLTGLLACGEEDPVEPDDTTPEVDAGSKEDARVTDTGTKPPVDTGTATPAENATLTALAGRYLVRFDNFGTAASSGFTIRSRVSVLVAAELVVDGAQLTAKERVCNQTVLQECKSNCQASTTVVDAKAVSDFLLKRTFARAYTVDGANFSAGKAVYALGYDDPADGNAPDSSTDARVWDVIKSAEPREGLLTKVTVTPTALPTPISCNVYGTQKFVSLFSGALSGSGASAAFPTDALLPTLDGSDAKQLGSDNPLCAPAQEPTSTDESASVRFARVGAPLAKGESWDCPSTADFDSKLPGGKL